MSHIQLPTDFGADPVEVGMDWPPTSMGAALEQIASLRQQLEESRVVIRTSTRTAEEGIAAMTELRQQLAEKDKQIATMNDLLSKQTWDEETMFVDLKRRIEELQTENTRLKRVKESLQSELERVRHGWGGQG